MVKNTFLIGNLYTYTVYLCTGTFCHQLISHRSRWRPGTTLVEVVEAVVKHLDEPDPDYAINYGEKYFFKDERSN